VYEPSDPRSKLASTAEAISAADDAVFARFYDMPPHETSEQADVWYARGHNFIAVYIDARSGVVFTRRNQIDEYVVLVPDESTAVEATSQGIPTAIPGRRIAFVPPGDSALKVVSPGRLVILITTQSEDLCGACYNNEKFSSRSASLPPFKPWPAPADGFALRQYPIDVPDVPGRFGRIWRCSTFMINFFPQQIGPRDVTQLSPHHHNSFEQGSLALEGAYFHHLRWPWTRDLNSWRDDAHERFESPSLLIIPPGVIHTSRAVASGVNQLVDIFSPPRHDFSQQDGWVLNHDDYPIAVSE